MILKIDVVQNDGCDWIGATLEERISLGLPGDGMCCKRGLDRHAGEVLPESFQMCFSEEEPDDGIAIEMERDYCGDTTANLLFIFDEGYRWMWVEFD